MLKFIFRQVAMKNKLYKVGSSQANKMYKSAIQNDSCQKHYIIVNCTKPGAKYEDVPFPDFEKIQENNLVIFQLFGNDLMKRFIQVTMDNNQKTIHLLRFVPESEEKILKKI